METTANPSRSAALAQVVEHIIRNDGVRGSSPLSGTTTFSLDFCGIEANALWASVSHYACLGRLEIGRLLTVRLLPDEVESRIGS